MKRNWKRLQPTHLRDAFRLCKDHAIEEKRLSVERIADLMGISVDRLYKYLSDASMPANLIPAFEHFCGADYVSRHLAVSAGKLVIDAPIGRSCDATDIHALQEILNGTTGKLIRFYAGKATHQEVMVGTTDAMSKLAWHRQNAANFDAPELDLGGQA
ncbi:MAG TPA: hypothetical protein VJ576_02650 [Rhodocyclaceae bacterium]|nr:hypothetical protein [Rhodocyclaceae bacterium]